MTTDNAANLSAQSHGEGDHVRVVLLGRTGLDASLREDESIEIVRARTPLEAVGEVASPPASARALPTIVVVGRGGEPTDHNGAFLSALREANPAAKLIRIDAGQNGVVDSSAYDAVLQEGVSPESLRAVLEPAVGIPRATDFDMPDPAGPTVEEDPCSREEEPPLVVSAPLELKPPGPGRGRGPGPGRVELPGDGRMLDALGASREVFDRAALELIQERTGLQDVEFIGPDEAGEMDRQSVAAVTSGKKRFGVLKCGGLGGEELASHAAWMGVWLSLHERQRSLRRAAFTDPLTGAWNRRYFDGFLASALAKARDARRTITVLVFDIDGFKQYNDRFGHPAGDEILTETVRALQSSVRPSDRVCRIGGDEFAVIFDEPEGPRAAGSRPPESVYVLAKRVQRKIAERKFPKLGADAPGELTVSGGLAAFPWDGHDAETLLGKADELACQSKRQGKNAITLGPGAERLCRGVVDE